MVTAVFCGHCIASYVTVEVAGVRGRNAAWRYRHPSPPARPITDHLAL
ncbi:MAG: DUF427 domain-containing protein [Jatrophihabitans sp.]